MNRYQMLKMKFTERRFVKKFPKFAKKQKVDLPENWFNTLQTIIAEAKVNERSVIFDYQKDDKTPNANARWSYCIRFNQWWALRLIEKNNDLLIKDAFRSVIAHEYAHDIYIFAIAPGIPFTRNQRFISHINEIIADVYGMKIAGFSGERAVKIMKLREAYSACPYIGSRTHPSAVVRTRFVQDYQEVSEKMIRDFAEGMKCKSERIKRRVIKKYSPYFADEKSS